MGELRKHNRADVECRTCGERFSVPHYRRDKAKYCGKSCKSSAIAKTYLNKGPKPWAAQNLDGHRHKSSSRFPKSHNPWNKGMKGIHLSPGSEFKPGCDNGKSSPFGTVSIRRDKQGKPRAFLKTVAGWEMRSRAVYAVKNGKIPDGKVIHHIDGDTLNDRPDNLVALSRAEHINEHRCELLDARDA